MPLELWRGFGIAPRPAFVLVHRIRRLLPEERAPRLRHPPEVAAESLARLEGVVLGPGELPIPGARVEVPGLGRSTYTDLRGCFHFEAVPEAPPVQRLRVTAKDADFQVTLADGEGYADPLIIHVQFTED